MFKINENLFFENVVECECYFENFIEQCCKNDVVMKRNIYNFFNNVRCEYKNTKNKDILFIKCDDCFYIVVNKKNNFLIENYYINDDFEFLHDDSNICSSLYDILCGLHYLMCDENVSRETLNIFDVINK